MIYRINDAVTKGLMVFAALWAFGLAFYIFVDVLARNLNMPIEGTAEIARDSIVTIVFLQLGYCVHISRHAARRLFHQSVLAGVAARLRADRLSVRHCLFRRYFHRRLRPSDRRLADRRVRRGRRRPRPGLAGPGLLS